MNIKYKIRSLVKNTDRLLHRLGWTPRWLCELADMSYGAPVDSFGTAWVPREQRMASRTTRVLWRLIGDQPEWVEEDVEIQRPVKVIRKEKS